MQAQIVCASVVIRPGSEVQGRRSRQPHFVRMTIWNELNAFLALWSKWFPCWLSPITTEFISQVRQCRCHLSRWTLYNLQNSKRKLPVRNGTLSQHSHEARTPPASLVQEMFQLLGERCPIQIAKLEYGNWHLRLAYPAIVHVLARVPPVRNSIFVSAAQT